MEYGGETGVTAETIVSRWFDAFNARNLEGMLGCLDEDVDFHPLRLNGCHGSYFGHDGVREWWAQLQRGRLDHSIVVSRTRPAKPGRILVNGSLSVAGGEIGPFCALHTVADRLIVAAHHYLSDPDMIEHLGLLQ
jgi:SnoaL-like domain